MGQQSDAGSIISSQVFNRKQAGPRSDGVEEFVGEVVSASKVVAAERGDYPLTQAGLVAAIAALPSSGGEVRIGPGTLSLSTPIVLPSKSIVIRGSGDASIIDVGNNAIAAFQLDLAVTPAQRLTHTFEDLLIKGDDTTAGQRFLDYKSGAMVSGGDRNGTPMMNRVNSRGIECYFYDRGSIVPTISNCVLFLTPGGLISDGDVDPSSTQLSMFGVCCDHDETFDGTAGGIMNRPYVAADECGICIAGGWETHGASMSNTVFYSASGENKKVTDDDTETCYMRCVFHACTYLEIDAPSHRVIGCIWGTPSGYGSPPDRSIDITANGDGALIQGNTFTGPAVTGTYVIEGSWGQEAVRTAADLARVVGNRGCKVLETGAADYNEYANLDADSTIIGPNSEIEGEAKFEGRIQLDSATQISLQRYKGKDTFVRGAVESIPAAGVALLTTDNRIDSAGADAGAAMAVDTEYYIYRSNSKASFAASDLRASTVSPTTVRGQKYLGSSGNAYNWRYVGRVRTISNAGTANFADSLTQRLVVNEHNRRQLPLFRCPGYVNDDASTTFNEANNNNWHEIHAGTGDGKVEYIANGEDPIEADAVVQWEPVVAASDFLSVGIGDNAATEPVVEGDNTWSATASFAGTISVCKRFTPAAGYRTLHLSIKVFAGGGGLTIYADNVRGGATADPPTTWLQAGIMG